MKSNFVSKTMFSLSAFTVFSYLFQLVKALAALFSEGIEFASLDAVTKGIPLVNGAATTSCSLAANLKNHDFLRTSANRIRFFFLKAVCKPCSFFNACRKDLFPCALMLSFLVLDFCFVLFCLYATVRVLCPEIADAVGITELTGVSNIKEVKGIRQCYLYLKQNLIFWKGAGL